MKTKNYTFCLAILIFSNACTVKIPLTSNTRSLHSSAQVVTPYFNVKKKSKTPIVLLGITSLATVGGYLIGKNQKPVNGNPPFTPEELTKSANQSAIIMGGAVFLATLSGWKKKYRQAKTYTVTVNDQNFQKWLKAYNNENNTNYVWHNRDNYSYLIIPKNEISNYEKEEDRQDLVAYLRILNGEVEAYQNYITTRPVNSKRYNEVLKMKDECEYYYRAMYSTPTNNFTFDNMLTNCEKYLKLYPQFKGNEVFFKNVVKRYNNILLIPSEIREKQIEELRKQAETYKQQSIRNQQNKDDFRRSTFLLLIDAILSPSSSDSSDNKNSYRECGNCNGRGTFGFEGKECIVCGGKGHVRVN